MKITEHLNAVEKLVLDRATPAEIRGQIEFIRGQLEAYEKDAALHADREKRILELEAEKSKLQAEIARRDAEADADPMFYVR